MFWLALHLNSSKHMVIIILKLPRSPEYFFLHPRLDNSSLCLIPKSMLCFSHNCFKFFSAMPNLNFNRKPPTHSNLNNNGVTNVNYPFLTQKHVNSVKTEQKSQLELVLKNILKQRASWQEFTSTAFIKFVTLRFRLRVKKLKIPLPQKLD